LSPALRYGREAPFFLHVESQVLKWMLEIASSLRFSVFETCVSIFSRSWSASFGVCFFRLL
jgi:hypothetical protein